MRFLHTADWHLGRVLHGTNLIEDQAYLLDRFVELAREEKPDAVLISGDVYDRSVPPATAVDLLDSVLCRLVGDLGLRVVLIAGNHDSAERLAFGSRLLRDKGLHIAGFPGPDVEPVVLGDKAGPVFIYPIPFAEPAVVRHRLHQADIVGHQAAIESLLGGIRDSHPKGKRSVVMAHCFVTGMAECESERPVTVGGSGFIDPDVFDGFNYVALGHLHRPQSAGHGIRYSGSLLPYSLSEIDHDKAVLTVDMGDDGKCEVREVQLTPRRRIRRVEGLLADVLAQARTDRKRDDYIVVTQLDQGPVFDAMGKLRAQYPNTLHIERPALMQTGQERDRIDHRKIANVDLFGRFFEQVTGNPLTDEFREAYVDVADALVKADGEVAR